MSRKSWEQSGHVAGKPCYIKCVTLRCVCVSYFIFYCYCYSHLWPTFQHFSRADASCRQCQIPASCFGVAVSSDTALPTATATARGTQDYQRGRELAVVNGDYQLQKFFILKHPFLGHKGSSGWLLDLVSLTKEDESCWEPHHQDHNASVSQVNSPNRAVSCFFTAVDRRDQKEFCNQSPVKTSHSPFVLKLGFKLNPNLSHKGEWDIFMGLWFWISTQANCMPGQHADNYTTNTSHLLVGDVSLTL